MRMDLAHDEALRVKGWQVFPSASRHHLVPATAAGAKLHRIRITEALPVDDTTIGVAQSLEERKAISNQRSLALALAERDSVSKAIGVTQYLSCMASCVTGNPAGVLILDEIIEICRAPFDGFITEVAMADQTPATQLGVAIRTSGGQSVFRSVGNTVSPSTLFQMLPDFLSRTIYSNISGMLYLRDLHVPVFSGESIYLVVRIQPPTPPLTVCGTFVLGFESFTLAPPGSAAAVSAFGAIASASRISASEASRQANALAIEQEKTRRAQIVAQKVSQVPQRGPTLPRVGFSPQSNPFLSVPFGPGAEQIFRQRQATPPPPPRVLRPKPEPSVGTDKTFVSAWNPSFGSIGYLIPNPPRGGKVNVFDNTYTIWDVSGRNVGSGPIEPVSSSDDIPPGATISPSIAGGHRRSVPPAGFTTASEE